jgi:tRNA (cmo5U34)-methyltransferase
MMSDTSAQWTEENSQTFIDHGRYFVPERELQIDIMCDLVPPGEGPFQVLELCCGEGLLAEAILERYPQGVVIGLDGSPAMLARASARLARFGGRFQARQFDLAAGDWRAPAVAPRAVVSSLAVHHLDGEGKRALFRDVHHMLAPGGALVVADVMQPADARGTAVAAKAWDAAVRRRAQELDGDLAGFALFEREQWNMYRYPETGPDPVDKPSRLFDQLAWLAAAGFADVDVYWMLAGHAIFGGRKAP